MQGLLIGEVGVSVARGLVPGVGVGLTIPVRMVRDRIRFEDLSRQSYVPPQPDTHHRNETLMRVADPQLAALFTRQPGAWTLSARLGTSVPLGRTEPNPFALGRLGLPHQHIQFGTGTWDPIVSASAARMFGAMGVNASASAKFALYENTHGYRAGNRYDILLGTNRKFGSSWGANAGFKVDREEPEKWSGRIEEEGNLGRTDLRLSLGIGHAFPPFGSFGLTTQVPLRTWATGEQVKYPLIVSMNWTR